MPAEAASDVAGAMRRVRYQEIADELRRRVRAAPAGSLLPSEKDLSGEFDASRVTVRKALDVIRDEDIPQMITWPWRKQTPFIRCR